jgi:hypothetical protein
MSWWRVAVNQQHRHQGENRGDAEKHFAGSGPPKGRQEILGG